MYAGRIEGAHSLERERDEARTRSVAEGLPAFFFFLWRHATGRNDKISFRRRVCARPRRDTSCTCVSRVRADECIDTPGLSRYNYGAADRYFISVFRQEGSCMYAIRYRHTRAGPTLYFWNYIRSNDARSSLFYFSERYIVSLTKEQDIFAVCALHGE